MFYNEFGRSVGVVGRTSRAMVATMAGVLGITRLRVSPVKNSTGVSGVSRSASVVLAALTLCSGAVSLVRAPLGGDETAMLVYAERIAGGDVANRDFFTVYGPGTYRLYKHCSA